MKKILILFVLLYFIFSNNIYADANIDCSKPKSFNEVIKCSDDFFNDSKDKGSSGTVGAAIGDIFKIDGDIFKMIGAIGNTVIAAVTVFLGIKYIFAGSEAKATIKNSLPNYLAGIIFFYLAGSLFTVMGINNSSGEKGIIASIFLGAQSYDDMSKNILGTIATLVQFASVVGIVLLGIKYMISSADEKAEFKQSMTGIVLGIAFAFSAGSIVNLIISVGKDILN